MNGSNVCIMSYGQTGTGKTFTMVGDDNDPGLYFKTVNEIFKNTGEK
jgi:kinesin family protein C2/C3